MTLSALTGVPKILVATSATLRRRFSSVPSEDMVAEVPTHCSSGAWQACRTRRMSMATSAPWRPRWVCSSSKTRKSRPARSEEHTSELQSRFDLVCRLLLEQKNITAAHQKTKQTSTDGDI